jgi:hypothetical protein
MKNKLREAYEAGQKSVTGDDDNGYSIDVDNRQTFDSWYESKFKNLRIPPAIKSICSTCGKLNNPYCSNAWHLDPANFR